MLACRGAPPEPAPVRAPAPEEQATLVYPPLADVLRDGVWTERGPHAVLGAVDTAPTLLAVIEERGEQVRVVYEDSWNRVAVWIPTDRLALTVLEPVPLAGSPGSRPRQDHAAVLLLPGIPVAEVGREGDRVEILTGDDEMSARGWVDADLLGRVWNAEPFPDDPEATHSIADGTPIRVSADLSAQVVATARSGARAVVLSAGPDWYEIQVVGSWMNVHGHVEVHRVYESAGSMYGGLIGGQALPPAWPDVPAGTCLVDEAGGEPIGVTLVEHQDQEPMPGGAKVHASTPWTTVTLLAEQTADGGWRSCPLSGP